MCGIEGISCQHLQVLMTLLLQKHWMWQENKRKGVWHGSEKRPTMYLASIDISRRPSMWQDQRTLRKLLAIKQFTDVLQRLHYAKWQAWKVRRLAKMLKAPSHLQDASAKGVRGLCSAKRPKSNPSCGAARFELVEGKSSEGAVV